MTGKGLFYLKMKILLIHILCALIHDENLHICFKIKCSTNDDGSNVSKKSIY